ncbi:cytochrome P450 704C1-like [Punica granatum]|uniref:Cytochrome P450 704C1-like n=1 Tax=Punica granatum TaxID=22663 RepID=A0A6P8D6Y6_PUNGR|nr:cytochrome P450 704C1-like [Punica granatum]
MSVLMDRMKIQIVYSPFQFAVQKEFDGGQYHGSKVKKGGGLNYIAYAVGRMTSLWGEDAETFRPERWLNENGDFRPESPYKFTAFHLTAGPRICLGKELAYMQMKILAALLLNFFEFRLMDETKEAEYRTMFTLHMDQGLHLYALARS